MYELNTIQAIFRNSSLPYVVTLADDPHFTIVCSTAAFNTIANTEEGKILNRSLFTIFPFNGEAVKDSLQGGLANLLVTKGIFKTELKRYEVFSTTGDKESKYWITESTPIINDSGAIDFIVHTITDVGDQLLAAERNILQPAQQEASQRQYRFFFDHHPDSVVVFDLNGNFIVANRSIARMAECSVEEVLNISFAPLIPPEDIGRVTKRFEKAVKGEVQRFITGFVSTRGKRLVIDGTLLPIYLNGEVVSVYGIGRDITSEVTAREKLKKREAQLQKILDYSLDLICTVDENRKLLTVSKASETILGYKPAELEGRPFMDFVYEGDRPDSFFISSQLREGMPVSTVSFKNRWVRKDGAIAYLSWLAQWDKRDKVSYCVARDITERIVASETLKASEERYRRLFHNNPLPMWIYERETYRFLEVNLAAVDKYGYSEEEFLNMTIFDIRPKEDFEALRTLRGKQTKYGIRYDELWRHLNKRGEILYVDISSQLIDYEGVKANLIIVNDVTEKMTAENALRFSEQRFKALVQEGSDFINILDFKGTYLYGSPSIASLFGVGQDKLIGLNGFSRIHPDDKGRVREEFEAIKSIKRARIKPYRFADSTGKWHWFESICTNLYDDPAVRGIVVNTRDVTESLDYLTTIEQQNVLLREIAYIQSHIVRAPLARIMGIIHVIRDFPQTMNLEDSLKLLFDSAEELDEAIQEIVTDKVYGRKINDDSSPGKL